MTERRTAIQTVHIVQKALDEWHAKRNSGYFERADWNRGTLSDHIRILLKVADAEMRWPIEKSDGD